MSDGGHAISSGLTTRSGREGALRAALERLSAGQLPDRPDTPDLHVTAVRPLPAVTAQIVPFPQALDVRLRQALESRGIARLYTHQAESIGHALAGRDVVVITPTASGKTLCYNAPVLHSILQDASSRALYLFPTKALAQDQLAELQGLCETLAAASEPIGVFTYDGDTPQDARRTIRSRAHLVLSNPDMLHSGILPHHPRWAKLFENLRYVIIDELHMYRGVFGSHLCNVLRRLRRVATFYGSEPQFVCCSATIANPGDLASKLIEAEVEVLSANGSPSAEKTFVFYNPPVVNRALGIRRSYLNESSRVAQEFLKHDLQTMVFANSRLHTELLLTYLQQANPQLPGKPETIRGYRGGYLPNERREIERGLRDGRIRGVVSTSALELGIDVGSLDTVVMAGYPGTIAATWQRAGGAGRRSGSSCAVLVASSAPLDQFIVRNPDYFFGNTPEHAFIQPDNLEILVNHLKCAAFELPIAASETYGSADLPDLCARLTEAGFLHRAGERYHWTNEAYPADTVSLRSVTSDNFVIVDITGQPEVIGEVDYPSALTTVHEKAIYLHGGQQYHVEHLDFKERKAYVKRVDADYYTDAIRYTQVRVLEIAEQSHSSESRPEIPALRSHGDVLVRSQVVGFKKIKFFTNENVGAGNLSLPENEMHTTSYWITLRRPLLESLPYSISERQSGMFGLLHALESIATLLLMCDRRDLSAAVGERPPAIGDVADELTPKQMEEALSANAKEFFEPNLYLFDAYPGGIGFSAPLFRVHALLLQKTHALIAACGCEEGCPSCVGPAGDLAPRAKESALAILDRLCA